MLLTNLKRKLSCMVMHLAINTSKSGPERRLIGLNELVMRETVVGSIHGAMAARHARTPTSRVRSVSDSSYITIHVVNVMMVPPVRIGRGISAPHQCSCGQKAGRK